MKKIGRYSRKIGVGIGEIGQSEFRPPLRAGSDNPICRNGPPGYIGWWTSSSESIPCLLKHLQIWALAGRYDKTIPTRFPAFIDCLEIPARQFSFLLHLYLDGKEDGVIKNK